MTTDIRLAAEWEPHGAVMLAWPHQSTDWAYMLPEVQQCYLQIIRALLQSGSSVMLLAPPDVAPDFNIPSLHIIPVETNDTWIRDYGPLSMFKADAPECLLDFRFNAWGQKFPSNFDNLTTRKIFPHAINNNDFVLEGGSIESDGRGTILTTSCCLLAPNRNETLSQAEIERQLLSRLNARKILWLDYGELIGDDTDGHIDTLCRLAPDNVILYTGCSDPDDEQHASLLAMKEQLAAFTNADGQPFNLIELPLPDPVFDPDDGSRLPATYANYLITDSAVLMPTYAQPLKDKLAADTLKIAFPSREIIPIDCRPLVRQHGSLHCATMQIPLKFFK